MRVFQDCLAENNIKAILPDFVICGHTKYVAKSESRTMFKDIMS